RRGALGSRLPMRNWRLMCGPRGWLQFAHDPEAHARVGGVGLRRRTPGGAGLGGGAGPRATAHHPRPAARVDPGCAVRGRAAVAVVPAVRHPFTDIAGHVVKAECIGLETGHRRRAPVPVAVAFERVVPAPATAGAVQAAGEIAGARRWLAVAPGETG